MTPLDQAFRTATLRTLSATKAGEGARRFALGRLEEGRKLVSYLRRRWPDSVTPGARVLDLGCGNGGIALAFAEAGCRAIGLDLRPRPEVPAVASAGRVDAHAMAGHGEALPFAADSFSLVLLLEHLEHLAHPRAVGAEVARVLRPGGVCFLTTPPRLRFLLAPDPHCGIPGLLLLPDRLQRPVAERLSGRPYDVRHTYWTTFGVQRHLPGLRIREVTSRHFAGPLRRLDWDWVVAVKDPT